MRIMMPLLMFISCQINLDPNHSDLKKRFRITEGYDKYTLNGVPVEGAIHTYAGLFSSQIVHTTNFKNGLKHGTETKWTEDNNISSTVNWVKGKKHGEATTYSYTGNKRSYEVYVEGECCTTSTYWSSDGSERAKSIRELLKDQTITNRVG